MLSNYFPYIAGLLVLILVAGGSIYFWQSSRSRQPHGRRRHTGRGDDQRKSDVYCHQCGTRAQSGDRFCRVCGTKLRLGENGTGQSQN